MTVRASSRPLLALAGLLLAGAAALALLVQARAEPLPAPTDELRDYQGKGVIVLDLPPGAPEGGKPGRPGVSFWFEVKESFVRPDRILFSINGPGAQQVSLVQDNVERTYSLALGCIVERTYKNLELASENPILAVQMSMVTYARLIRDMKSGKLLPDDDIEKLEKENKARIAQLEEQRKQLTRPEDIAKRESVSAEMVRLREELQQTLFRRANPCTVVEFDNKDVLSQLFARRLTEDAGTEFLAKGKTRLWVTKAEGLPIKIETTDNDGHVVIFFCFTDLKINAGLRAGELGLNAPPYTRMISVTADLKLKDWQERMDRDLSQQFARADKERRPQPGTGARPRPRK